MKNLEADKKFFEMTKRFLTSCFGLGLLPLAPGTWASLLPALIFSLLVYFDVSAVLLSIIMASMVAVGSFVCIGFSPDIIGKTGNGDPREIVADEFAGQALTFLIALPLIPKTINSSQIWVTALLGFLLFRLFDISKPFPLKSAEKLPKGWGILVDDLLAAVYAGVVLLVFIYFNFAEYLGKNLKFEPASLNMFSAGVLGIVQGLTEFLPVSSSGHLVMLEHFFKFDAESSQMILFDLAVHTGTVIAIFIVFRKSIAAFYKNLIASGRYGPGLVCIYKKSPAVHILILAVIATVVTAFLAFLFEDYFTRARGSLLIVALMWLVTGSLLLFTDLRKKTRIGLRQFSIMAAVVVGVAQAAAIMPGISRSGATICTAILIGLHRRWAVEFSFLLAIPAILGATVVQIWKNFAQVGQGVLSPGAVIIGMIAAVTSGVFALKLLIIVSRRAKFKFFAFYCYFLAFLVLFYHLK